MSLNWFFQVSFLAAVLGPEIAAASAQKSLEVLLEEDVAPSHAGEEALTGSTPKISGML